MAIIRNKVYLSLASLKVLSAIKCLLKINNGSKVKYFRTNVHVFDYQKQV